MNALRLRRLHPDGAEVTVDEAADQLSLADRVADGRPYVVANMVCTVDGHAAIGGRAGPIGGEADRALFHALRGRVDAVMAGTGTLTVERYGRLVRDAAAREARARRGLAADPLACVVSRSGRLPMDIPLFQDPDSTVVVYTAAGVEVGPCPATVIATHLPREEVSLGRALGALHSEHGVRTLLCEGGPILLGALVREGLLDELFVTLGPLLGGGEPVIPLIAGPPLPEPAPLRLLWALEHDGELMLRYGVGAG